MIISRLYYIANQKHVLPSVHYSDVNMNICISAELTMFESWILVHHKDVLRGTPLNICLGVHKQCGLYGPHCKHNKNIKVIIHAVKHVVYKIYI